MTKRCAFLICALLAAVAVSATFASTSFFGPTGLIVMPTAEILGQGQVQLYANYLERDDYHETPYGVNLGLGQGMELGISTIDETGDNDGTKTIVNAKYALSSNNMTGGSMAVGAINAADHSGFRGTIITADDGEVCPYIVMSKKTAFGPVSLPLTLHVGYIGGMIDGTMLGASADLTPNVTLMADWVDNFSDLSYGISFNASNGLSIKAAAVDGDFTAGLTFSVR